MKNAKILCLIVQVMELNVLQEDNVNKHTLKLVVSLNQMANYVNGHPINNVK